MSSIKLYALICISLLIQSCSTNSEPTGVFGISPPTPEEKHKGYLENEEIKNKLEELNIVRDYSIGLMKAKNENKPIVLIFTGYSVINSTKLEHEVIVGDEAVFKSLKNDFVNIWLYTDSKQKLQVTDTDSQSFNTHGEKWSALQKKKYNGNFQPHIFILDSRGKIIKGDLSYPNVKVGFANILNESKSNKLIQK